MADWNVINPTETDPGAPVTSSLVQRLRDNPEAVFEAAATAPGIDFRAMDRAIVAGDVNRYYDDVAKQTTNNTSGVEVLRYTFVQTGTVRFKASIREVGDVSGNGVINLFKNDVLANTLGGNGTSFSTMVVDLSIVPGDTISLKYLHNSSGTAEVNFITLATDGGGLFPNVSEYMAF